MIICLRAHVWHWEIAKLPKSCQNRKTVKKKQAGKINHKQEFHEDTENKNFKFQKYGKGNLDITNLPLLDCSI